MNDWLLECVKECFNEWMNEQMKKWVSEQWTSNLLPLLHQKIPYVRVFSDEILPKYLASFGQKYSNIIWILELGINAGSEFLTLEM